MTKIILIGLRGEAGASLRYATNEAFKNSYFMSLPLGIMLVNFFGCLLIGLAMAQLSDWKSNLYFF